MNEEGDEWTILAGHSILLENISGMIGRHS